MEETCGGNFTETQINRSILFYLEKLVQSKFLKLIGFLLPFELLLSYVAHAIFKPTFGEFYRVFFNGAWGAILVVILLSFISLRKSYIGFFYIAAVFILGGIWEYVVTILLSGLGFEATSQFFCGFFFPAVLFLTLLHLNQRQKDTFFKYWYVGTIALIIFATLFSVYNYSAFPEWFRTRDLEFRLISFRYAYDADTNSNPAIAIMGNFNKASNYLLIMLLFSVRLIPKDQNAKAILIAFWTLATIALVLMFSRLVLLLLPFVFYYSGIRERFCGVLKNRYFYLLFFLFIGYFIFQASDLVKPTFEYFVYSKFDDNSEDLGVLGTGLNRFEDWGSQGEKFGNAGIWLHGLGVGNYGLSLGSKDLGTHNLFLDHFFASGIIVPLIIFLLWSIGFLKALILKDFSLVLGFLIIMALFFREYSFSYLYVTSQGGVLFMLLLAIQYLGSPSGDPRKFGKDNF